MKKNMHRIAFLVMVLPLIYLVSIWAGLPQRVPTHFNLEGTPDHFGSKIQLILIQLMLTAVNAGVYLLLCNIHRIDPRKTAVENKGRMQSMGLAVAIFIVLVQFWLLYITRNRGAGGINFIFICVGLLFSVIGNYMYHIRPNYFAGIRLPWTLENADNWRKTHQLAGRLWFLGGLLIALFSALLPLKAGLVLFFIIVAALVLVPFIYSYQLFKKHNA